MNKNIMAILICIGFSLFIMALSLCKAAARADRQSEKLFEEYFGGNQ